MRKKFKESFIKKQEVSVEFQDLEEKKQRLESDIEILDSDYGIESHLRDTFGVIKEGENVVVLVDSVHTSNVVEEKEKISFWGFVKNLFISPRS